MTVLRQLWVKSAHCFGVGGRNGHLGGCDKRGTRNNDHLTPLLSPFFGWYLESIGGGTMLLSFLES